jgi:hypothetical protein
MYPAPALARNTSQGKVRSAARFVQPLAVVGSTPKIEGAAFPAEGDSDALRRGKPSDRHLARARRG